MTPKAVVNAIEVSLGLQGPPRQLRDAIEAELLNKFLASAAQAAEQSDRLLQRVTVEIDQRRAEKEAMGEIAVLNLRGSSGEIVCGSSYVFGDDPDAIKVAKLNRVFASEIRDAIRKLTFQEFELFGKCVLRELGANVSRITPHAGDQGIDFYGELTVGALLNANPAILRLMHDTKVFVVGQAKNYPESSIGPSVVRELVGALSLSRTGTFSRGEFDLLDGIMLCPFSPLLAMLFTTGDFTKGARTLAKRAGLITFSGWQLAVFLADRGVGVVSDDGNTRFEPGVFRVWLLS